jgi:hypothetical protein
MFSTLGSLVVEAVQVSSDLFFESLVCGYVEENTRFLRRTWLAEELDDKLRESRKRLVLLTAEPGAGKSVFMAQLAHDHRVLLSLKKLPGGIEDGYALFVH